MSVQSLPLLLQELGLEPRGLLENESRAEGGKEHPAGGEYDMCGPAWSIDRGILVNVYKYKYNYIYKVYKFMYIYIHDK